MHSGLSRSWEAPVIADVQPSAPGHVDTATGTVVRTLPVRVTPLPYEGLDSYLESLAARLDTSWGDLTDAVGLDPAAHMPGPPFCGRLVQAVTATQLASVSAATGVTVSELRALTLPGLLPSALSTGAVSLRAVCVAGSRFCPRCLAARGGRWCLWWQLRWAFACPVHECLLADTCALCGLRQRTHPPPRHRAPILGRCTAPTPGATRGHATTCGADLTQQRNDPLPIDHPALSAQQHILDVLAAGSAATGIYAHQPLGVPDFLRELTVLGQRALRTDRSQVLGRLPADLHPAFDGITLGGVAGSYRPVLHAATAAPLAAAAGCLVVPVVASRTVADAGDRLQWLAPAASGRAGAVRGARWGGAVSGALRSAQVSSLSAGFSPIEELRFRCASGHPGLPHGNRGVNRSVPGLLWPEIAAQWAPDLRERESVRAALSVAVLLVNSPISMPHACALLGGAINAQTVSRILRLLHSRAYWPATAAALVALADALAAAPSPIDYQGRRALPLADLLPPRQWRTLCRTTDTAQRDMPSAAVYRCWLAARLTGFPMRRDVSVSGAACRELPHTLTPELVASLDAVGRRFLENHGLSGEPVVWQPTIPTVVSGVLIESP